MKIVPAIAALAALLAAAAWQRNAISKLRVENQRLRVERLEAVQLADEGEELSQLRATARRVSAAENTVPATELLRLRGEVNRLRVQTLDPARLRTENQRLAAEIASGQLASKRLAEMDGFIPRDQWAGAGLATPEAALQSYFAAILSADLDLLLGCLSPENALPLQKQFERDPARSRNEFRKDVPPFLARAAGFRVAERRQNADGTVTLDVQFAADGLTMSVTLRPIGSEWRIAKWEQ